MSGHKPALDSVFFVFESLFLPFTTKNIYTWPADSSIGKRLVINQAGFDSYTIGLLCLPHPTVG